MDEGGALESPDGGCSFRDSAGVCGVMIIEEKGISACAVCVPKETECQEGSTIEEAVDM